MEVYVTSGGEPKQALQIGGRLGDKEIENQLRFSLDIQYFAKNSRDYGTIKIPKREYAAVTHELNTWLKHDEVIGTTVKKSHRRLHLHNRSQWF